MYTYEVSASSLGVASHMYSQSHTVNTPAPITPTAKRPASITVSTERAVLRLMDLDIKGYRIHLWSLLFPSLLLLVNYPT
jgi:hypothetical protein